MLWQHDPTKPIGVWDEVREDGRGLYVKGRLLLDVQTGREAQALLVAGAIDGLSIGYRTVRAEKAAGGRRLLHEIELFAECYLVGLVTRQRASQQFAEMFDDADGALSIVVTNEHGDRVEGVEEKVRVELGLEIGKARAGELFGEPRDLHFTFACVDEVTRCVLNADDAEIDSHSKR